MQNYSTAILITLGLLVAWGGLLFLAKKGKQAAPQALDKVITIGFAELNRLLVEKQHAVLLAQSEVLAVKAQIDQVRQGIANFPSPTGLDSSVHP